MRPLGPPLGRTNGRPMALVARPLSNAGSSELEIQQGQALWVPETMASIVATASGVTVPNLMWFK